MEETEAKKPTPASPLFSFSNPSASFGFGFGAAPGPPPPPPPPAVEVLLSEESPVAAGNLEPVVVDDSLSIYKVRFRNAHLVFAEVPLSLCSPAKTVEYARILVCEKNAGHNVLLDNSATRV
uniref:Uncharacterized protein n=1 Tax=Triticum urartu TaxID=4572 RepID=A0A8R7QCB8_TRIUA